MSLRRSLRSRPARDDPPDIDLDSNISPRPTRRTRAVASSSLVTVSRTPSDTLEESNRSLRLTVKMPSSKLREVTGGSTRGATSTRRSHNVFTENPIITGPRASRTKKKLVEINTSDEDEDLEDQEEDEVDDEDAPGEDDEDVDADGDMDMDDAPPQPPVSKRHAKASAPSTPAKKGVKSVEAKEMELDEDDEDEDDEELSELESDAEGEPDDLDESGLGNANAGEEELDEEDEEDEEDSDSDEATVGDLSRLTKRQRGSLGNDFLQLPMEPQVKKHLTAEERAMRRAEMARRRKNLSEKRNEEEKMDTINRLLKKQAPKRRGRIPAAEAEANAAEQEALEQEKLDPTMIRWISSSEGSKIRVPEEWLGTPAGHAFGQAALGSNRPRKLVEEV